MLSIEGVIEALESRRVTNAEKLCGQLLSAIADPVLEQFDRDREKDDIGPGVLVHRLKAATKQTTPAVQRRDAKARYEQDLGKWSHLAQELFEWPEGAVLKACRQMEGVKPITVENLKAVLGPSPLDHDSNRFPEKPAKDDGGKRKVGTVKKLDARKAIA